MCISAPTAISLVCMDITTRKQYIFLGVFKVLGTEEYNTYICRFINLLNFSVN
jgi:hypothetical protein